MCYGARGDYYQGDYYHGDPGFLGSVGKFLGKAIKTAVRATPLGAVASQALTVIRGQKGTPPPAMIAPSFPVTNVPGIRGALQRIVPFGATGLEVVPNGAPQGLQMIPGVGLVPCPMKGQRLNKTGYYKQVQPGNPYTAVYVPPKSVCVKTRRINIANPRALRRAVRRAQGFAKMARRVMTFVSAKAPKGRAKFKRAR